MVGLKLGMMDYILINGDIEAGAFISRDITAEVFFFFVYLMHWK